MSLRIASNSAPVDPGRGTLLGDVSRGRFAFERRKKRRRSTMHTLPDRALGSECRSAVMDVERQRGRRVYEMQSAA